MSEQRMVSVELLNEVVFELLRFGAHYPAEIREADQLALKVRSIIDGPGVEPVAYCITTNNNYAPPQNGERWLSFDVDQFKHNAAKALVITEVAPLYLAAPSAPVQEWPVLEKPALVGGGRFHVGVSSRLVVEAAQRHYENEVTPEKEAERVARYMHADAMLAERSKPCGS